MSKQRTLGEWKEIARTAAHLRSSGSTLKEIGVAIGSQSAVYSSLFFAERNAENGGLDPSDFDDLEMSAVSLLRDQFGLETRLHVQSVILAGDLSVKTEPGGSLRMKFFDKEIHPYNFGRKSWRKVLGWAGIETSQFERPKPSQAAVDAAIRLLKRAGYSVEIKDDACSLRPARQAEESASP